MGTYQIRCPECRARLTIQAEPDPGYLVRCPSCRETLTVQANQEEAVCPFCGTEMTVPPELRGLPSLQEQRERDRRTHETWRKASEEKHRQEREEREAAEREWARSMRKELVWTLVGTVLSVLFLIMAFRHVLPVLPEFPTPVSCLIVIAILDTPWFIFRFIGRFLCRS